MKKKIGVLLSGCGVFDGSEIHETVLTLLSINRAGAKAICMAPDMQQEDVFDHFNNKQKKNEKRNILVESARIARGDIKNLETITANDIDGIILPGGLGAIKNLSNFASNGLKAEVHPQVKRILNEMVKNTSPIGAICIAPITVVKSLSNKTPLVTIGNDTKTVVAIENMGGKHMECGVNEICVDKDNLIISTPAYMLGPDIKNIFIGIEKLVLKVIEFCNVTM